MIEILRITLPLYGLIAIGLAAVRSGYLTPGHLAGVNALVMRIFLPAMIFLAIAGRPVAQTVQPGFFAAYLAAGLATLVLAFALARLAGQTAARASVEAMGAACPNSGYFGLPMITLVLGAGVAAQGFALAVIVENMLVIPLAIALCDVCQGAGPGGLRRFAAGLLRNPLLIAAGAGLAWALSDWPLPDLLARLLVMMNPVAAPAVLVAIGGALAGLSFGAEIAGAARVSAGKLLLHPLMALLFTALLAPDMEAPLRAALILFAASPMMTIYTAFGTRYGAEGLAVTAMLAAITASVLTVPAVVWLIGA